MMKSSKFKVQSSKLKNFLFFTFCFLLFTAHYSLFTAYAETIKVLIVNELYPKIPVKGEHTEKLGRIKGDLLVMGTRYSGNIEVWKGDNGLYLVNELPLEDYVMGVVAGEVGADWEIEALKAQAVISRTYAVYQKKVNGNSIYHITSSVLHQVYKGSNSDSRIARAVTETSGEVLTFDNKPIEAFYHSTSCESTENPEEVFGKSYPYLKAVESKCDLSPYCIWERRIQLNEIEKALNISGIQEITIRSNTSTNRVKDLYVKTTSEINTINTTDLRKALGWNRLPSTNFTFTKDGDSLLFEGKGYGHGVGLCQWCALEMAREGKNYKDILSFFYPGTTIQLYESH
jgi:stage II sporulation protein D